MEFFSKVKAVKLRSHLNKYLVADDDQRSVRQSRKGLSRKARWLIELVEYNPQAIRLRSCYGGYLTASISPFLLGFTGNKVLQSQPEDHPDLSIEWVPVRDGFQVRLVTAFGGTFLRANGGTPPWRNSVTHDTPSVTRNWILWDVEAVEIPENEDLTDYLSMVSSFSSLSDDFFGSELGSPLSKHSNNSLVLSTKKNNAENALYCSWPSANIKVPPKIESAMDLFNNAKAVRLRSHHEKYLSAEEDEESVTQDRNGASKNVRWAVEFVTETGSENIIRLKSCYGKYLTASNMPFLLGMTGRKVLQTSPSGSRLDSSVEWEPICEGNHVKLKTRYGNFLRANGGLPPWRNSVTHDIPYRSATQDWILWDVHIVEIVLRSPQPKPAVDSDLYLDSFESVYSSSPTHSVKSSSLGRQESNDSMGSSPIKAGDGRVIYYSIADELGNVDEGLEGLYFTFKGNGVYELTQRLEEETRLEGIIVCTRSSLNGKLYPLRLQLPPNNVDMHVVVLQSSSRST